ncbi:hypothetical protein NP233_g5827 [Leucocoprinus birnbaumii]|uniref:Uncharacterized protein n=1 Tax=Leucocoprinus birnbaumii TaxID=56174 RepID=A0AAD5VS43_9AGAR|nr:hypothetical protein NP233_g5827 [Leucocoprinus birnbaumii]
MATSIAPAEPARALPSTDVEATLQMCTGQNALVSSTQKAQDYTCHPSAPDTRNDRHDRSHEHSNRWQSHPGGWQLHSAGAGQHKAMSGGEPLVPAPTALRPKLAENHSSSNPQAYSSAASPTCSMTHAPFTSSVDNPSTSQGPFPSHREVNPVLYRSRSTNPDLESQKLLWQYQYHTALAQQSATRRAPGPLPDPSQVRSTEPLRSIEWGACWVETILSEELNRMYTAYKTSIAEVREQLVHEQDEKEILRRKLQELEVELKRLQNPQREPELNELVVDRF